MMQGVVPSAASSSDGPASASSFALPVPAGNLQLGSDEALRNQNTAKPGKKTKTVATNQARTKMSLADTKLGDIETLKEELDEKPDEEMPLPLH